MHAARPPTRKQQRKSSPSAASESTNRPAMLESHKHLHERPITNRPGQQYPGEIAAGGPATPEGLLGKEYAKEQDAYEKPHAKTQNCSPFSATESTNTQPRIGPCSRPVHPNLLPADAPEFIARRDSYHAMSNPRPRVISRHVTISATRSDATALLTSIASLLPVLIFLRQSVFP